LCVLKGEIKRGLLKESEKPAGRNMLCPLQKIRGWLMDS
jgi:hypothetical protein